MAKCAHCENGWLGNRFGQDVECVNGVLIDIDVAHEGWTEDEAYPSAPCEACPACKGASHHGESDCAACNSTGWKGGKNRSQELLEDWSNARAADAAERDTRPTRHASQG